MLVRNSRGNAQIFRSTGAGLDVSAPMATSHPLASRPILADLNGDGRAEVVAAERASVCISDLDCDNNQHCARPGPDGELGICADACVCQDQGGVYPPPGGVCPSTSTCGSGAYCANLDLDASAECFSADLLAGSGWRVHQFAGFGNSLAREQLIEGLPELSGHGSISFADVDGDGDPDLLRRDAGNIWALGLNNGGARSFFEAPTSSFFDPRRVVRTDEHEYGSILAFLDLDRDRTTDVLFPIAAVDPLLPNTYTAVEVESSRALPTNLRALGRDIILADVTGDGIADAIDFRFRTGGGSIGVQVNTDNGFGVFATAISAGGGGFMPFAPAEVAFGDRVCSEPVSPTDPAYCQEGWRPWWQADLRYRIVDLNQDGRQDVVALGPEPAVYLASNTLAPGSAVFTAMELPFAFEDTLNEVEGTVAGSATTVRRPPFLVGDLNGDGQADFVYGRPSADGAREDLVLQLSREGRADLLTHVTNGLGARDSIEYAPLSDASVYDDSMDHGGDEPCGFPYTCLSRAMPVVARLVFDNPGHARRVVSHRYAGGRRDARTRQLLGFMRVYSRDETRGSEREVWVDTTLEVEAEHGDAVWPYHPLSSRPTRVYESVPLGDEVHVTRTDIRYESEAITSNGVSQHPLVRTDRLPRGFRVLLRDNLRRQYRFPAHDWHADPSGCGARCELSDRYRGVRDRTFAIAWRMDRTHFDYRPRSYGEGRWNPPGFPADFPVASAVSRATYRGDVIDVEDVPWSDLDDFYASQITFFERTVTEHAHDEGAWLIARPVRTEVERCEAVRLGTEGLECRGAPSTVRRHTSFEHWPNGRVRAIHREPDAPDVDAEGRPTGLRLSIEYTWERGNIVEAVRRAPDGEVRREQIIYDPLEETLPVGLSAEVLDYKLTQRMVWEPSVGVMLVHQGPNGAQHHFRYDGLGRLRGRRAPGAAWVDIGFSAAAGGAAMVATESGPGVVDNTTLLDARMRVVRTMVSPYRDGSISGVDVRYDALGRSQSVTVPSALSASDRPRFTAQYDAFDRLLRSDYVGSATDSPSLQAELDYRLEVPSDPFEGTSEVTRVTDALGRESETWQGLTGWVDRTRDQDGPRWLDTETTHDLHGAARLVTRTHGEVRAQDLSVLEADRLGRPLRVVDADRGEVDLRYNAFGEVVWQRDADGEETELTYDQLGRPLTRIDADGTTRWQWDTATNGRGLLQAAYGPDGTVTGFEYDEHGRVVREEHEAGFYEYRYDPEGRIAAIIYPSSPEASLTVSYEYEDGYLARLREGLGPDGPVLWEALRRHPDGRVAAERTSAGVVTDREYDPRTRRLALRRVTDGSGAVFSDLRLGYRANGELETRQDLALGRSETFDYDDLERLTLWTRTAGGPSLDVRHHYDDLGNLTGVEHIGAETETLRYEQTGNAGLHAPTSYGDQLLAYDAAGRRTESVDGQRIEYNRLDLPTRVRSSRAIATFRYDAFGRRIQAEYTGRVGRLRVQYAGDLYERREGAGVTEHVYAVVGAEGVVAQIRRGAGLDETRYFHTGELGSVTLTTDADGKPVDDAWFSPFGRRIEPDGALASVRTSEHEDLTRGFTGHEHDGVLGLINMRGRVYDVTTRAFLTPDPFVAEPHLSQGWNRYAYVRGSPTNFTDPTGFERSPDVWITMEPEYVRVDRSASPSPPGNPHTGSSRAAVEPTGSLGNNLESRLAAAESGIASSMPGGASDGFSGSAPETSPWFDGASELVGAFGEGAVDAVVGMAEGLGRQALSLPFFPSVFFYRGYYAYENFTEGNYVMAAVDVASIHPIGWALRTGVEAGIGAFSLGYNTARTLDQGTAAQVAHMGGTLAVVLVAAIVTRRVAGAGAAAGGAEAGGGGVGGALEGGGGGGGAPAARFIASPGGAVIETGLTPAELVMPGGARIGQAGASSAIRIIQGGGTEARMMFEHLAAGGVPYGGSYAGTAVSLPGGGFVGLRMFATGTGARALPAATIDLRIPGIGIRELKFIP